MNRIILIGNGFDKASELKTGYDDFLLWYFQSIFEGKLEGLKLKEDNLYKDQLISIERFKKSIKISKKIGETQSFEELQHLASININGFSKGQMYGGSPRVIFHSNFFKRLLEQKTWGEIESEYFKELYRIKVKVFDNRNPFGFEDSRKRELQRLNKDFDFIRDTFSKYIKEVDKGIDSKHLKRHLQSNFFTNCFEVPNQSHLEKYFTNPTEVVFEGKEKLLLVDEFNQNLEHVVFINFNYTSNLIKQLFSHIGDEKTSFQPYEIRIHGDITIEDERGIIFGYGDDTAKEYREIEQDGNNEYLRFMKSTQYFHDDKYKQIISYINDDRFELFVAGHSLSLSDRVLLKTIVEHENCRLIRFFHRGNYEDYRTLVGAMTRHFDDKIKMRDKFLPYDKNDTIS